MRMVIVCQGMYSSSLNKKYFYRKTEVSVEDDVNNANITFVVERKLIKFILKRNNIE